MNGVSESMRRIARQAVNAPRRPRDRDEMGKLAAAFDGLAETLSEKNDEARSNKQSLRHPEEWMPVLTRFYRALRMRRNVPSIQELLVETVEQVFPACAVVVRIASQSGFRNSQAGGRRRPARIPYAKIPLVARGETLGTLSLFGKKRQELRRLEFDFLALLADQAAAAMDHVRVCKKTEDQTIALREAKHALANAQVSNSEFLSIMSHEFRTPLNLVMGYTEIMQEELAECITAEQAGYLQRIIKASEDILALVMSMLHVGSIEADCVELTKGEVGLSTLLRELQSELPLPEEKDLKFVWDVPADLPIIWTDAEKLKHVLHKLIDNAVKFTEQGQVRVSSRSFARLGKVEITISDTGIGIPNDALPSLFEKYRQLDGSIARMYDGMGVGLFIAKAFTEMLGGKLKVASEPGEGSTFTVALPVGI